MTGKPRTALRALLLCQAVLVAGLTLSFPYMTLYLHERRGLPMTLVGCAIALALVSTACGQALGGELSDLLGCKKVMGLAVAGRGAAAAGLAVAAYGDWPVPAVVALHCSAAFIGNFYDPSVRAWIAHEHPASDRVRAYGMLRVAANAAWAIGPAVGGLLAGYSYPLMFAVTSASCGFAGLLLYATVPAAPAARADGFSWLAVLKAAEDKRYLRFCGLTMLLSCAMGQLVSPLSVHAREHAGLSERAIGLLFTLNGVGVVLLQRRAARWISDGRRLTTAAALGALFYAAGWAVIGFSSVWAALAAGILIITLGEVVISPSLTTLAANLAPEDRRGRYLGFQGLSYQLGHAIAPVLGGWGLDRFSGGMAPVPWLAAGALAGAASFGFSRLGRRLTAREQGLNEEVA